MVEIEKGKTILIVEEDDENVGRLGQVVEVHETERGNEYAVQIPGVSYVSRYSEEEIEGVEKIL
jgi:hypothetical protein